MIKASSPKLDTILESLANQKRRCIIDDLSFRPSTVGTLAIKYKLSLPAIHKHIRNLEKAKLIVRKKSGRTNFVALDPRALGIAQQWITQYQTGWSSVNSSLENYISRMKE